MSSLLITGASGNIGTAVLRRLQAQWPDLDVVAIARREPPPLPPYDRARWYSIDLSEPSSVNALGEAMAGVTAVLHLAWGFQPTRDPDYLRRLAVEGSARVLAAAQDAGVEHLVHMSSVGTYAPRRDKQPVAEDYPHTGMPTSTYSAHKAAVEALLDAYERQQPGGMTITRLRPGLVMQRAAGAALSRYAVPAYLPARMLTALPLLPLSREFAAPVVHADDVADAVVRVLRRRAGGAFNLAAPAPLTRDDIAAALRARPVHVPAPALRAVVGASWRLHLQPLSPDWIDLAFAAPLESCARAAAELDWRSTTTPRQMIEEVVRGIADNAGTVSPALRPRNAAQRVAALARSGPVSSRRRS